MRARTWRSNNPLGNQFHYPGSQNMAWLWRVLRVQGIPEVERFTSHGLQRGDLLGNNKRKRTVRSSFIREVSRSEGLFETCFRGCQFWSVQSALKDCLELGLLLCYLLEIYACLSHVSCANFVIVSRN